MHAPWKRWPQVSALAVPPTAKASLHTAHSRPSSTCAAVIATSGRCDRYAADAAGLACGLWDKFNQCFGGGFFFRSEKEKDNDECSMRLKKKKKNGEQTIILRHATLTRQQTPA
jgi:hypothetical protein